MNSFLSFTVHRHLPEAFLIYFRAFSNVLLNFAQLFLLQLLSLIANVKLNFILYNSEKCREITFLFAYHPRNITTETEKFIASHKFSFSFIFAEETFSYSACVSISVNRSMKIHVLEQGFKWTCLKFDTLLFSIMEILTCFRINYKIVSHGSSIENFIIRIHFPK